MNRILVALCAALLVVPFARAQDDAMMQPVPDEMKLVSFMTGHWEAKLKMTWGPEPVEGTGTSHGEMVLDGRYVRSMHTYSPPGMPPMTGMHVMTFDPAQKKWVAWWFDSTSPGALEMSGDLVGDTLTMVSKPTEMPGMPGPFVMRTTWKKASDTRYSFKLEMQQGDQWSTLMEGDYVKK
jgi:hypothetical protein